MELDRLNQLSGQIIGCALEVHRLLGPGLLESLYEEALCYELSERKIIYERQKPVPIRYKGKVLGDHRLDILVDHSIVVELKAVDRFDPVHRAQILSYLKLTGLKLGLLINFNRPTLKEGVQRIIV